MEPKHNNSNTTTDEKYVLSFGAGLNSTALLIYLVDNGFPLDEVVFADTGGEIPETYTHLKNVDTYLSRYGILLTIVRSKSGKTLYDKCMSRKVIPSQLWRWSTRDFKITPIYSHYRSLEAHVNQYLGIAYEERDRKRESGVEYVTNTFPLIDKKFSRQDCVDIILASDYDFSMPVRSGCFFCPFNSLSRWTELFEQHKDLFIKAMLLEENSKHFPKQRLMKFTLRGLQEKLEANEPIPEVHVKRLCSSECLI
ncbi:MAG: phosphoadenosine phosphosulfate reductase family protein [Candidatus Bathyarchaeia archaeon]